MSTLNAEQVDIHIWSSARIRAGRHTASALAPYVSMVWARGGASVRRTMDAWDQEFADFVNRPIR